MATIDKVETYEGSKPAMARIFRDDSPNLARWFCLQNFIEIDGNLDGVDNHTYYLISSVVKVDTLKEKWLNASYNLQVISQANGWSGLSNKDGYGIHMIGYQMIDKKEFDKLKKKLFIEKSE